MQDPSTYSPINPQFPEHEHLKCPRCDSNNTKFCYYNNYNLLQPRHFCKHCKRYWTKGGTLRNIPVGGATRKITKRSSNPKRSSPTSPSPAPATSTSPTTASSSSAQDQSKPETSRVGGVDRDERVAEIGGSLCSPPASGGQFGNCTMNLSLEVGGFTQHPNSDGPGMIRTSPTGFRTNSNGSDRYLAVESGDGRGYWNGGNRWPGLSIFTTGSDVQ